MDLLLLLIQFIFDFFCYFGKNGDEYKIAFEDNCERPFGQKILI